MVGSFRICMCVSGLCVEKRCCCICWPSRNACFWTKNTASFSEQLHVQQFSHTLYDILYLAGGCLDHQGDNYGTVRQIADEAAACSLLLNAREAMAISARSSGVASTLRNGWLQGTGLSTVMERCQTVSSSERPTKLFREAKAMTQTLVSGQYVTALKQLEQWRGNIVVSLTFFFP